MAVIIYGTRHYGRVDEHGGEYAATRFFHLYFMPIIPVGTTWFTGTELGHTIKLSGKSVAAAYLRMWGPIGLIAALAGLATSPLSAAPWAIVLALLIAFAWSWRSLRGEHAQRRSDFNFVAFGTRCEPGRMTAELRASMKQHLDRRWAARQPDRTPDEVAAHGARDTGEAIVAYGLLRLASIDRGAAGKADAAAADRILAGNHTAPAREAGPYRAPAAADDAPHGASLDELVAHVGAARAAARNVPPPSPNDLARAFRKRSRRQGFLLAVGTFAAIGGLGAFAVAMRPALDVTAKELASIHPPTGRTVHVACDAVEEPRWQELENDKVTSQIAMCELGTHVLPIKLGADDATPASGIVTGRLRFIPEHALWVREGLNADVALQARSYEVYLDVGAPSELGLGITGLALGVSMPILWVLWFRARRRHARAIA